MRPLEQHAPDALMNILIADDDEGDRKQVKRALKQAGLPFECTEAQSIDEALMACASEEFDCAIVDYRMPGRDGLEGIAALSERQPFMSIIMSTGEGDETVATEAMKRGASDYIRKVHINPDSIRRGIENAVEKSALRRRLAQQRVELEGFAQILAHDLNAPIASIQLFAQTIQEDLEGESTDRLEMIALCRQVVSAGRRSRALIDTLHQYTKTDSIIEFRATDMNEVIDAALANLNGMIEGRAARVIYDRLPLVNGNTPQLIQVFQNLIGNAIKYCTAQTPAVQIGARPDQDGMWLFTVSDNGIGIPEVLQTLVFEPFKRLHGAGEYDGTGLGLAICKKYIERHGGRISCEANPQGQGSVFSFTLQASPGAEDHRPLPDWRACLAPPPVQAKTF